MKIIGAILVVIAIIVGVCAYNMETSVSGFEEYSENMKNYDKQVGRSDTAGLTNNELIQKKIAEKNQTFIISGVLFLSGIILVSRRGKEKSS